MNESAVDPVFTCTPHTFSFEELGKEARTSVVLVSRRNLGVSVDAGVAVLGDHVASVENRPPTSERTPTYVAVECRTPKASGEEAEGRYRESRPPAGTSHRPGASLTERSPRAGG